MSDPNLPPDRQDADSGLLATLALAVVFGLLLFLALRFIQDLQFQAFETGDWASATRELRLVAGIAAVIVSATSVVLGLLLRRIGDATLASRRFPPRGTRMAVREALEGAAADARGRELVRAGWALLVGGPLVSALGLWWVFRL